MTDVRFFCAPVASASTIVSAEGRFSGDAWISIVFASAE